MSEKQCLKVLKMHPDAVIPTRANPGDAGMDLYSIENVEISPGERVLAKTGLAIEVPFGMEAQIRPRSGLALKKGVSVLNTPGTVDAGYRGEVCVILINHSNKHVFLPKGDRIAQMVLNKVELLEIEEISQLSETERGEGGFGSTGV